MTDSDNPISRPQAAFLALLPVLVLFSRALSDATASLCMLGLLGLWIVRPATRWFQAPWFGGILLLWLFMLLGTSPLAMDPAYSFQQSVIFMRWPMFALCLCLVFFTDEKRIRLFENAALAVFLFIVFDSVLQYVTGTDLLGHARSDNALTVRLTGPFSKTVPGIYAMRIYCMAAVALWLLATVHWRRQRWLLLGAFMVLAQGFALLTGERIVFLLFGFVNAAVVAAALWRYRPRPLPVLAGTALVVAAGAAVAVLFPAMMQRNVGRFVEQLQNFGNTDYYKIFEAAVRLWQHAPWTGVGTRYYSEACYHYNYVSYFEGCAVHPHNIYLEWLSQNGLIGLLLFIFVVVMILRTVIRGIAAQAEPVVAAFMLMAVVSLFWPFMTSMSMLSNNYAGPLWLGVAWALARATLPPRQQLQVAPRAPAPARNRRKRR